MHFKGGRTNRYLLVIPKDKDNILQKMGVIYNYKCGRMECEKNLEQLLKDSKMTTTTSQIIPQL